MIWSSPDSLAAAAGAHGLDDRERREAWFARVLSDRSAIELLAEAPIPVEQGVIDVHGLTARSPRDEWPDKAPSAPAEDAPDAPWSVRGIAAAVANGDLSAVEAVERSLELAQRERHLNAFVALFGDRAVEAAAAIDVRVKKGEDVGPLAGVPFAVKDLISMEGHATTGGTRALRLEPSERDAACVARLREAGAVVVGAANLHGLAYGAMSVNPDYGRVLNPCREGALAGGSSGGSGAAVGAGIVPASLGTDTGGSVRIPASCCGAAGLKPTFGRVSNRGVYPLSRTMDHVGPIARDLGDVALVFEAISETPFDAGSSAWQDLDGITIGRPTSYFFRSLDSEVEAAASECIRAMVEAGGRIVDVDIPSMDYAPAAQLFTVAVEAFEVHRELLREDADGLPEDVRLRLETGMFFSAADYVRAQRLRGMLRDEVDSALEQADVLLTPTVAVTVPDAGRQEIAVGDAKWPTQFALSRLTMPFTATGHPALTLPWKLDRRQCPIGMQLVGRPMEEATILGAGRVLERRSGWTGGRRSHDQEGVRGGR